MFDVGWAEALVFGVALLLLIGPRDMPWVLRTFGFYAERLNRIARGVLSDLDVASRVDDDRTPDLFGHLADAPCADVARSDAGSHEDDDERRS